MSILSPCIDVNHIGPGAYIVQKGALDPLELDLQMFVTHHVVLGTELRSSERTLLQVFLALSLL